MSLRTWSTEIEITERKEEFSNFDRLKIDDIPLYEGKQTLSLSREKISLNPIITGIHKQLGFQFRYCELISELQLKDVNIISDFNFNYCLFSQRLDLYRGEIRTKTDFSDSYFLETVVFQDIAFKGDVCFYAAIFQKDLEFHSCTFEGKLCFENTVFKGDVKFQNCIFKGEVDFRISDTPRDNSQFYRKITGSFNDSIFEGKVLFYNRYFGVVDFINTRFKKLADFYNATFVEPTRFFKTDFEGTCVFAKTTFQELIVFHYAQVSKNMILRNAKFKKGANFSLINFIDSGFLNVFDIKIEFPDTSISCTVGSIDDGLNWQAITIRHVRETFRILKHEALKQNNRIAALEYHALEMEWYEKELFGKKKSMKVALFCLIRDFYLVFTKGDRTNKIILFVNRISNGFGLKPFRGLFFTLIVTLISYVLFVYVVSFENEIRLSYSVYNLAINFKQVLLFLNVTNWKYYPFDLDYNWAYGVLFFGRIVVGYGIYQTIQAFRKFGRL